MLKLAGSKIVVIGALIMLFLVGFLYIRATVQERQSTYRQVMSDIARNNVGAQSVLGPFVVVPIQETVFCDESQQKTCEREFLMVSAPQKSAWQVHMRVDDQSYHRGIYKAITYQNTLNITGHFTLGADLQKLATNQKPDWSRAEVRLYLSDMRGLKSQPLIELAGQKLVFAFPEAEGPNPLGLAYTGLNVGRVFQQQQDADFSLNVDMGGMGGFQVLPLGKEMAMTMTSNWPDPSFFGASLPDKQMSAAGFQADWKNTFVANRNTQLLTSCLAGTAAEGCKSLLSIFPPDTYNESRAEGAQGPDGGVFGVNFIQAVDVYLMTDRAIKYALLFLVITFGSFFLFEVLKDLRIHPMQYTLVGAAQAVFYLLLLSFSEHLPFAHAYLGSGAACVLIIAFYVSYVLQSLVRSLFFAGILSGMYLTLYVILQSEDFTLMLGSVLVFVLIASAMVLTRKVNWYALGQPSSDTRP